MTTSTTVAKPVIIQQLTVMDQKTVRKLEEKIQEAMSQVMAGTGLKTLPLLPSPDDALICFDEPIAVFVEPVEAEVWSTKLFLADSAIVILVAS